MISVNERGQPVGEDHPRAKLNDAQVEHMRQLHEKGWSYGQLAKHFLSSKSTVCDICNYRTRGWPIAWRTVQDNHKGDKDMTPKKKSKKIEQGNKSTFLTSLAHTCNVSKAAEAAGVSRTCVYEWRKADPAFATEWEHARRVGAEALEDEAVRRAYEGVEEPIFFQGAQAGIVRRYSDTLLIFLLKGALPEKYAERHRTELTGAAGGPLKMTDDQMAMRIQQLIATVEARVEADEFSKNS